MSGMLTDLIRIYRILGLASKEVRSQNIEFRIVVCEAFV